MVGFFIGNGTTCYKDEKCLLHSFFLNGPVDPSTVEEKLCRYVHILLIIIELASVNGKMQNCCVG
jgi:hypothetical protein